MEVTTPALIWFITGVILFLLEMVVPGFILFFFGLGAWFTALLSWLLPVGMNGQILIFTVSSVISLVLLRKLVQKTFLGGSVNVEEDEGLAEKGTQVEVLRAIYPPAEGRVKYSGTTWRAVSEQPIEAGKFAEVVQQQGLIMKVKPLTDK